MKIVYSDTPQFWSSIFWKVWHNDSFHIVVKDLLSYEQKEALFDFIQGVPEYRNVDKFIELIHLAYQKRIAHE
jgi:hypothetical protein